MSARADTEKKSTDPQPVWMTADIAAYLRISPRQAQRWVRSLLSYKLEPISWRPLRIFQDDFLAALRRRAADIAASAAS